jgi:hypothetical protein
MEVVHPLQQKHVRSAKLYATRVDLINDLVLPQGPSVAEIGVAFGDFSLELLRALRPAKFVGLDLFELHHVPIIWGKPSSETFQGLDHLTYYTRKLESHASGCTLDIKRGDSSALLSLYPDASFDLIYIDGAHDYAGVKKDADVSVRKVKPDGYLIFNDYIYFDHLAKHEYGIIPVVNDLCANHGWKVAGFAFQAQMFCDICLKKDT